MRRCSPITIASGACRITMTRALFELLTLEGAQAGLSWRTILARRDEYRRAYHGFDIARVAGMRDAALEKLLTDIRHHPQPAEGVSRCATMRGWRWR